MFKKSKKEKRKQKEKIASRKHKIMEENRRKMLEVQWRLRLAKISTDLHKEKIKNIGWKIGEWYKKGGKKSKRKSNVSDKNYVWKTTKNVKYTISRSDLNRIPQEEIYEVEDELGERRLVRKRIVESRSRKRKKRLSQSPMNRNKSMHYEDTPYSNRLRSYREASHGLEEGEDSFFIPETPRRESPAQEKAARKKRKKKTSNFEAIDEAKLRASDYGVVKKPRYKENQRNSDFGGQQPKAVDSVPQDRSVSMKKKKKKKNPNFRTKRIRHSGYKPRHSLGNRNSKSNWRPSKSKKKKKGKGKSKKFNPLYPITDESMYEESSRRAKKSSKRKKKKNTVRSGSRSRRRLNSKDRRRSKSNLSKKSKRRKLSSSAASRNKKRPNRSILDRDGSKYSINSSLGAGSRYSSKSTITTGFLPRTKPEDRVYPSPNDPAGAAFILYDDDGDDPILNKNPDEYNHPSTEPVEESKPIMNLKQFPNYVTDNPHNYIKKTSMSFNLGNTEIKEMSEAREETEPPVVKQEQPISEAPNPPIARVDANGEEEPRAAPESKQDTKDSGVLSLPLNEAPNRVGLGDGGEGPHTPTGAPSFRVRQNSSVLDMDDEDDMFNSYNPIYQSIKNVVIVHSRQEQEREPGVEEPGGDDKLVESKIVENELESSF
jgi:hypothetical protein